MKRLFSFSIVMMALMMALPSLAQEQKEAIPWMSFEDAIAANAKTKKAKKKIFIDVYTSWCGWCTRMDQTTFKDSAMIATMNKYFLAVKLDAERKDTVNYKDKTFVNPNPGGSRSAHQLAISLLNGRMSYPSFVILNENDDLIQVLPGYREAKDFVKILIYFGEDIYLTKTWEEYQKAP